MGVALVSPTGFSGRRRLVPWRVLVLAGVTSAAVAAPILVSLQQQTSGPTTVLTGGPEDTLEGFWASPATTWGLAEDQAEPRSRAPLSSPELSRPGDEAAPTSTRPRAATVAGGTVLADHRAAASEPNPRTTISGATTTGSASCSDCPGSDGTSPHDVVANPFDPPTATATDSVPASATTSPDTTITLPRRVAATETRAGAATGPTPKPAPAATAPTTTAPTTTTRPTTTVSAPTGSTPSVPGSPTSSPVPSATVVVLEAARAGDAGTEHRLEFAGGIVVLRVTANGLTLLDVVAKDPYRLDGVKTEAEGLSIRFTSAIGDQNIRAVFHYDGRTTVTASFVAG